MPILTFRNVVLSFGHQALLDGVSFEIDRGERLCLVGRNGSGKSTLLRLAVSESLPDDGEITRAQTLRVALLAQEVPQGIAGSVFQVVAGGLGAVGGLIDRYHRLAHEVVDGDTRTLAELERCQHELESTGGWALNQRVETTLSRTGLDVVVDEEVGSLSGGLKRRVMLARALVTDADLLLLDEPTNHLDIEAITWLEEFLLGWGGTLLFITHDRAFLQRLATRIIELDRGRLTDFPGDYATYLARKEALLVAEEIQNALFDKKLALEEAWIRQGIKARRTRNEGRVRALKRLRAERAERRERTGQARLYLKEGERSGTIVIEAENVCLDYDGRSVIRDLSTTVLRGDKVGIIGPNGSGKTTLLRLLLGELLPTRGTLRRGTNLGVAYFDQYRAALEEEKTVQENVGQGSHMLTLNGERRHVLSYLQDFLFTPDRARQPVKVLSGGERNRLLLAKLFIRPANVLVLDEPTNDLDADTLDLLEEVLIDYPGTLLLVSHDRAFLNNVVTSTLAFEGDGVFKEYVGGYDDWLRQRPARVDATPAQKPKLEKQVPPRERPKKLSYKDQRELDALPQQIEALEAECSALHARMSTPEFYQQDKAAISEAQARVAQLDAMIQAGYARWEALEALRG
ncbi:MAG: ATP-binding cassette domain-containing protein [Gammaproteobacteria bacterium]